MGACWSDKWGYGVAGRGSWWKVGSKGWCNFNCQLSCWKGIWKQIHRKIHCQPKIIELKIMWLNVLLITNPMGLYLYTTISQYLANTESPIKVAAYCEVQTGNVGVNADGALVKSEGADCVAYNGWGGQGVIVSLLCWHYDIVCNELIKNRSADALFLDNNYKWIPDIDLTILQNPITSPWRPHKSRPEHCAQKKSR